GGRRGAAGAGGGRGGRCTRPPMPRSIPGNGYCSRCGRRSGSTPAYVGRSSAWSCPRRCRLHEHEERLGWRPQERRSFSPRSWVVPPWWVAKGTLVEFRKRLIAADADRRLVERSVQLAERSRGFGATALRAALDSSPLWGAGRVEDTYNLMGHALRKALGVLAAGQGRGLADGVADLAGKAGTPMLAASSLKAA